MSLEDKKNQIEKNYQDYLNELHQIEHEYEKEISDFLDQVKEKKIKELRNLLDIDK